MARLIQELIHKLKSVQDNLDLILMDSASVMAHDAKGLAERIIKEKGFGASYSTKTYPAFFFYGKQLNAKGSAYLETIQDDPESEGTNWGLFRKAQGLQNSHVDLTYTTRMWKGMRPDEPQKEGSRYFCYMGHNDQEGQKKMNWNYERYGHFLGKALEGQEEILREVAEENIRNLIEETLMK